MDSEEKYLKLIVGTYAGAGEESVFLCRVKSSGEIKIKAGFKAGKNPSYMVFNPGKTQVFAVNETEDFKEKSGAVTSFLLENEELIFRSQISSEGKLPVFIDFLKEKNCVLVANYTSGTAAVLPVDKYGNLLPASSVVRLSGSGPDKERQASAHAHQVIQSPDKKYIFAVDLGSDQIRSYRLFEGRLIPGPHPVAFRSFPGSGPRQLVFHPDGKHAFLVHEIRSLISFLKYNPAGFFREIQTLPCIPAGFDEENKCGGVKIFPDGKTVFVSNRGHNSLVSFLASAEDETFSRLEFTESQGIWPREFCMDPEGELVIVANQKSGTLHSFHFDQQQRKLRSFGFSVPLKKPVFCMFY